MKTVGYGVVRRLKKGAQGLQGCIVRITQWAHGVYYRNDTELTTTPRYLDVVMIPNSSGIFTAPNGEKYNLYEAKAAHNGVVSSTSNMPSNTTYWTAINEMLPIYTPLLLAENAVFRFGQSQQLLIQKADGTVTAGCVGLGSGVEGIRFFAGDPSPSTAPFRVNELGQLVATDALIEGLIRTGASGARIELNKILNKISIFNSSGVESIKISPEDIRTLTQIQNSSSNLNTLMTSGGTAYSNLQNAYGLVYSTFTSQTLVLTTDCLYDVVLGDASSDIQIAMSITDDGYQTNPEVKSWINYTMNLEKLYGSTWGKYAEVASGTLATNGKTFSSIRTDNIGLKKISGLGPGSYRINIIVQGSGYSDVELNSEIKVAANTYFYASQIQRLTEIGANGLALVWSTQKYVHFDTNAYTLRFDSYLVKLSSSGIQKSTDDGNTWSAIQT